MEEWQTLGAVQKEQTGLQDPHDCVVSSILVHTYTHTHTHTHTYTHTQTHTHTHTHTHIYMYMNTTLHSGHLTFVDTGVRLYKHPTRHFPRQNYIPQSKMIFWDTGIVRVESLTSWDVCCRPVHLKEKRGSRKKRRNKLINCEVMHTEAVKPMDDLPVCTNYKASNN